MAKTPSKKSAKAPKPKRQLRARPKPISGDCQDGCGKAETDCREVYEGHFKDGQPHGEGSWTHRHREAADFQVTTTGIFERGDMVIGTVTVSTDANECDHEIRRLEGQLVALKETYDKKRAALIRSMEEESAALKGKSAALKEELAVAVQRAAVKRASDGASWTGTWAIGKPSGEGVWRLRDGREVCGACPEDILGDVPLYWQRRESEDAVPLWVHETATIVAVPAPEAPQGDEGAASAAELPVLQAAGAGSGGNIDSSSDEPAAAAAAAAASGGGGGGGGGSDSSSEDDEEDAAPPAAQPVDQSKLCVADLKAELQKRGVDTKGLELKKDLMAAFLNA